MEEFLHPDMIKYAVSSVVRCLKQNESNDIKPSVGKMTGGKDISQSWRKG